MVDEFVVGEPEPETPNGAVPAPERPGVSPDAPYGRKPDGTPYKRRPYTRRGPKSGGRRSAPKVDIQAGITEMHVSVGMLALLRGDVEMATLLIGEKRLKQMMAEAQETPQLGVADAAGDAWAKIAAQSPAWEQFFTKVLQTGVWAEVMNAYLPLAMMTLKRRPIRITVLRRLFARRRKPAGTRPGQRPVPPQG